MGGPAPCSHPVHLLMLEWEDTGYVYNVAPKLFQTLPPLLEGASGTLFHWSEVGTL